MGNKETLETRLYVNGEFITTLIQPIELKAVFETEKEGSENDERNRRTKFNPFSVE